MDAKHEMEEKIDFNRDYDERMERANKENE
jgi:hypothetical protein